MMDNLPPNRFNNAFASLHVVGKKNSTAETNQTGLIDRHSGSRAAAWFHIVTVEHGRQPIPAVL